MPNSVPLPLPPSLTYNPESKFWSTTIDLPRFSGIRIDIAGLRPSTSLIQLYVKVNRRSAAAGEIGPSAAQANAFTYFLENQERIIDVCLAAIANMAQEERSAIWQWMAPKELDTLLPTQIAPAELKTRIQLSTFQIDAQERDGLAYIEYRFSSAWDLEHRLLVVLHKDRLVYSGGSGDGWRDRLDDSQ